jgi:hypothetical protein
MTNPYRSQRERAAYEAGLAARAAKPPGDDNSESKVLTREEIRAMSTEDINRRWPEVQQSLRAGLPSGEDDDE